MICDQLSTDSAGMHSFDERAYARKGPNCRADFAPSGSVRVRSRSPHPYLLRRTQLHTSQSGLHLHLQGNADTQSRAAWEHVGHSSAIRSGTNSLHGKSIETPTESGTEADDEGYGVGLVKALPPPPLRPRKGLKDVTGTATATEEELLTPRQLDEDAARFSLGYFDSDKKRTGARLASDENRRVAKLKFLRRRRGELLRRATETVLLTLVGVIVMSQESVRLVARQWRTELITHLVIIGFLYVLYPLRLIAYSWRQRGPGTSFWGCIRIPAAFDPAPLLYPVYLPVLISLSVSPRLSDPLLANLVLSLASLPIAVIPQSWPGDTYFLHWFLSVLPLMVSETAETNLHSSGASRAESAVFRSTNLHPETAILLFPLHRALLPLLHYLTTTSLLPTELQLLSVTLIDLLLFSQSPQAIILSTILWVGGLGIYVFLRRAIVLGVALARVPKWRFKRAARAVQYRNIFVDALQDSFTRKTKTVAGKDLSDVQSDADEEECLQRPFLSIDTLKAELLSSLRSSIFTAEESETKSATETSKSTFSEAINGSLSRKRRYTLPSLDDKSTQPDPLLQDRRKKRVRGSLLPRSFLSMTVGQAAFRKWLYASYVYTGILLLIALPIRLIISRSALDGFEPVGWALGYLFGNIQPVRFNILMWSLDCWIPLPPLATYDTSSEPHTFGRAEFFRSAVIGEANTRLIICMYFIAILVVGLAAVLLLTIVEVDTRRKVFHGMMVAMLLSTIFVDPCFISLALGLVLAIFLILDLIRASQLPPLSKPIAYFLTPYVDGRDLRGPVVISHIFLLIGCAVPLWLSLASEPVVGEPPWRGWEVQHRDLSMISGVVCVGMGDAAASLIGRRYGRKKWPWTGGKSIEGSAAFAVAVTAGLCIGKLWLWYGQWPQRQAAGMDETMSFKVVMTLGKAGAAACCASLMEAVLTGGNDNVLVPVVLWLVVRALGL